MTQDTNTYVLYTEHHKELHLAEYLTSTILQRYPEAASRFYVPKAVKMWHYNDKNGNKQWEEREDLLFYNYVFTESSNVEALNQVLKGLRIDTGYHLIGKNRIHDPNKTYEDQPIIPVSEADMTRLNTLLGSDGIVGKSTFIKEGSHVEFLSGPLKGMEADVKKIFPSKHYAIVEMEFLGEIRRISLAIQMISKDAKAV